MTSKPLLPAEFRLCARHCWCAFREDDPIIKRFGAELIVRGMKELSHEHGTDPNFCFGCLTEAGQAGVI